MFFGSILHDLLQNYSRDQPHLVDLLVLPMPYFDVDALLPLLEYLGYIMRSYEKEEGFNADIQHPFILLITPQQPPC